MKVGAAATPFKRIMRNYIDVYTADLVVVIFAFTAYSSCRVRDVTTFVVT